MVIWSRAWCSCWKDFNWWVNYREANHLYLNSSLHRFKHVWFSNVDWVILMSHMNVDKFRQDNDNDVIFNWLFVWIVFYDLLRLLIRIESIRPFFIILWILLLISFVNLLIISFDSITRCWPSISDNIRGSIWSFIMNLMSTFASK